MSGRCKYPERYYWDDLHNQHSFKCDEAPLESGYCLFHDPEFLNVKLADFKQRADKLISSFDKKIKNYFAKKEENWLFIGYIIPGFELRNVIISANVYFTAARIRGNVEFKGVKFQGKVSFQGAHFEGNMQVSDCEFAKADFDNNTHFHGNTSITKSDFLEEVTFLSAIFFEDFSCSNVKFRKGAIFGYIDSQKEAQFGSTEFFGEAHFHMSKFKDLRFHECVFYSTLAFNVTNSKRISLTTSTLNKIFFNSAKVKVLQFWQSKLQGETDFSSSEFTELVDFRKCEFNDHLNYENTTFGEVDFSYSYFRGSAHFIETKFLKPSFFNYTRFQKPEDVIFQRVNLSRVSFVNTDLTRINFGEGVQFGDNDEFTTFDEKRLINYNNFKKENDRSRVNLGNVLSLYRGLRENYEYRLRYDEASKLFIKEMELRRNYKE